MRTVVSIIEKIAKRNTIFKSCLENSSSHQLLYFNFVTLHIESITKFGL